MADWEICCMAPTQTQSRGKCAVGAAVVRHCGPFVMFSNGNFDHSILHLTGVLGSDMCACGCVENNCRLLHFLCWHGLKYLHHDYSPQILHRDIKSNNILVDLEYEAHLADFGIARMVDPTASLDLSSVAGSLVFIPPEYSFGPRVTEKIDIYSFGVVLLELVTGKRAADPLEGVDGANLVQWVHNRVLTPKGMGEILDSKCGRSSQSEMVQVLRVGMLCTNYTPASRPSMREVVKMASQLGMNVTCRKDLGGSLEFDEVV